MSTPRFAVGCFVVAAALGLALPGCSSSAGGTSQDSPADKTLTVYAAASLTEAFDTLKPRFEASHPGVHVTLNYGASSDLSQQIVQGASADVFASASPTNMATVVHAGDADPPALFAKNRGAIALPPGNPGHIRSLADLARNGVKVAVCAPAVPCGVVAAKVFSKAGLTVHPVADEKDVKSTLAVVESGEVDAGIVYVTDVHAAGNKVSSVPIPDAVNASTDYPIAVMRNATNSTLAKAWVALVRSQVGQRVLAADGFEHA